MNKEKNDTPKLVTDTNTQVSSTRLIEIDAPEGSPDQSGTEQAPVSAVEIQIPSGPPAPVEQIVHEDGTITFNVGDRFIRPLMAHIGCDGEIDQTHSSEPDAVDESCNTEDSQGERK